MATTALINVVRWIFLFIDKLVYGLIEKLASLFNLLARGTIFSQTDMDNVMNRIYLLVALIMLFRLAFSFINYIINPDQLTDKGKGGGKLVIQIVISLVLLVMTPTIFNEAYNLQGLILQENVIGKLITGREYSETGEQNSFGQHIAYTTFRTFYTIDSRILQSTCGIANTNAGISADCVAKIDELNVNKIGSAFATGDNTGDLSAIQGFKAVSATVVDGSRIFDNDGKIYIIDYLPFLSTIAGGVIAYLFLCFCFDVAIRMVKLGFLQLIAPIPIVMSLAPGQKKNPLSSWGTECFSTYISLFLRLAVVYLAFYIIELMFSVTGHGVIDTVTGTNTTGIMGLFVNLFAVIGSLLFAKEAPKLIEQLFGMKGSSLTLNPLKKLKETPIIGGAAAGAIVGAGALAGGVAGTAVTGAWGLGRAAGDVIAGNGQAGTRLRETGARMGAHLGASFAGAGSHAWAGITGGKSKGVHDRYKDNVNNIKKDYKNEYGRVEGEKLYKKYDPKTDSKYDVYKSSAFASAVKNVDLAKKARDDAQSEYEIASRGFEAKKEEIRENAYRDYNFALKEYEATSDRMSDADRLDSLERLEGMRMTAENTYQRELVAETSRVDGLRKEYGKSEGTLNKAKAELDDRKKVYKRDAERYERYSAADDRHSLDKFQSSTNTDIPRNNGNNSDTNTPRTRSFGDDHGDGVTPF